MTSDSDSSVLSLGLLLGDYNAETKLWRESVASLMKEVMRLRAGMTSPLNLNVVFHVDGKLVPTDFVGVRTGRFSKKDSHLMVQAAVPAQPDTDRYATLMGLLRAAVDEAEAFARGRGIAESLPEVRRIVARLSATPR